MELEAGGAPEVHAINVRGYALAGCLDDDVELERIEVLLVGRADGLRHALELGVLEQLGDHGELCQVENIAAERQLWMRGCMRGCAAGMGVSNDGVCFQMTWYGPFLRLDC